MFFILYFFFFNDPATTEIYTLSLHDALPISCARRPSRPPACTSRSGWWGAARSATCSIASSTRSEEHTSELQSRRDLVCRLLLEKKKKQHYPILTTINTIITTADIALSAFSL